MDLVVDPFAVYSKSEVKAKLPKGQILVLDTTRFGRRFVPGSTILRTMRIELGLSAKDLSKQMGMSDSWISVLETRPDRVRGSGNSLAALAIALGLCGSELDIAFRAQCQSIVRAVYYPDDPGSVGPALKLPLPGAAERIIERERIEGPPYGAEPLMEAS